MNNGLELLESESLDLTFWKTGYSENVTMEERKCDWVGCMPFFFGVPKVGVAQTDGQDNKKNPKGRRDYWEASLRNKQAQLWLHC